MTFVIFLHLRLHQNCKLLLDACWYTRREVRNFAANLLRLSLLCCTLIFKKSILIAVSRRYISFAIS
mgnify:CR=1 FL=1